MPTTHPEIPKTKIRVLYIASEAEPFVKVGGLGDVAGSLPHALKSLPGNMIGGKSIDIRMVIPYHSAVREKLKESKPVFTYSIPYRDSWKTVHTYYSKIHDVPVFLLGGDPIPFNGPVYSMDAHLDSEKYVFFSIAALELVRQINWAPHIIQANDWHTAPTICTLALWRQTNEFYMNTRSILSIHNLPYMGADCRSILRDYHIQPTSPSTLPEWAQRVPLPLGIASADQVVTVSPTYAQEIQTPEFGCGLDQFLRGRHDSITGIINGLNYKDWDPETDKNLASNFSINNLQNKQINKLELLNKLLLKPDPEIPLFIMVTRMDHQKGVDLAVEALRQISDQSWQAIILGTGDPVLENLCRSLESEFPNHVRASIRFDSQLARRMYAAGDMLIMPSRYEPCGLTQMISMRYGCVPVARSTGGLRDTIQDIPNKEDNTGFLFEKANAADLAVALRRALSLFLQKDQWSMMKHHCMLQNFSWEKSALTYTDLYFRLLEKKP